MENPYRSPESKSQSAGSPQIIVKPSQVTVFGILHILAALMGFGGIIVNKLLSRNPKDTLLKTFQQDKDSPATFTPEALEALDKALSLNLYFEIVAAILATMLLTSGLAMLLNARWGIKLSNNYCLLSILTKIISIVLLIAIVMPAYQAFCDGISGADETLTTTICLTLKFSGLLGAVATMIYPALALIFLTRATVKQYQQTL